MSEHKCFGQIFCILAGMVSELNNLEHSQVPINCLLLYNSKISNLKVNKRNCIYNQECPIFYLYKNKKSRMSDSHTSSPFHFSSVEMKEGLWWINNMSGLPLKSLTIPIFVMHPHLVIERKFSQILPQLSNLIIMTLIWTG